MCVWMCVWFRHAHKHLLCASDVMFPLSPKRENDSFESPVHMDSTWDPAVVWMVSRSLSLNLVRVSRLLNCEARASFPLITYGMSPNEDLKTSQPARVHSFGYQ